MKGLIAVNEKGYIGLNGKLPWKNKADLKHFQTLTMGCKLLVGYNTFVSLPELKGREIIVDSDTITQEQIDSIDWCIGGAKTYEKYCHLFTELHISYIDEEYTVGDVVFPQFKKLSQSCKIVRTYFDQDDE